MGDQDVLDKAITLKHVHDLKFSKVAWNTFKKKDLWRLEDWFEGGRAFWAELRESGTIFKKTLRAGELGIDQ